MHFFWRLEKKGVCIFDRRDLKRVISSELIPNDGGVHMGHVCWMDGIRIWNRSYFSNSIAETNTANHCRPVNMYNKIRVKPVIKVSYLNTFQKHCTLKIMYNSDCR